MKLESGMPLNEIFSKTSITEIITAGVASLIPVLINYFNPADTRYGKKGDLTNLPPDPKN